jgi:ubiquinone/menaquinone biosynthesis C-methylase UbiE
MSPTTPLPRPTASLIRLPLARRSTERELLDAPMVDRHDLNENLRDLARVNRLPGGARASIAAIDRLVQSAGPISILDAGTGGADIPKALLDHARRAGTRWSIVAVDRRSDVLEHAMAIAPHHVRLVLGDATRLPFADGEFDVAHSSLLLHHLDPEDVVAALREMARVARIGVVVNDLRRGLLAFALGAPVLAFARSGMTRHDGLISLRRAYTLEELDAMLAEADLEVVWRSNRFLPRVVTAARRRTDR